MANTISTAVNFLNNEEYINALFLGSSLTQDLLKPNTTFVGAKTAKIQKIAFGSSTMGKYDRDTGYTENAVTLSWAEVSITQDVGNELRLDRMDEDESRLANGIMSLYNRYMRTIAIPEMDKYCFSKIASASGIQTSGVATALTKDTVMGAIDKGFTAFINKRININSDLVLYVNASTDALIQSKAEDISKIRLGEWNGVIDTKVAMYKTAKYVVVPDDELVIIGEESDTAVPFLLINTNAVVKVVKYQEVVANENVPKHGHRLIALDIGFYYDLYLQPDGEKGVYAYKA
jgi:hypothetical protein